MAWTGEVNSQHPIGIRFIPDLPEADRTGPAYLLHFGNEVFRRTDTDAADVGSDAHLPLAFLDDERDAAISLVLREKVPQLLERAAIVRRRREADSDGGGQFLAEHSNRH